MGYVLKSKLETQIFSSTTFSKGTSTKISKKYKKKSFFFSEWTFIKIKGKIKNKHLKIDPCSKF